MHANTQNQQSNAFDSAALFNVRNLFETDACDPMGPCQSDGNESGLRAEAVSRPTERSESSSGAVTGKEEPIDPQACNPMGPCQSDGNESGLVGDIAHTN